MTAKTLEKVNPVNLGGLVHPTGESVYSVDDIATGLPTSVAIFPNADLGGHYDQLNVAAGKKPPADSCRQTDALLPAWREQVLHGSCCFCPQTA